MAKLDLREQMKDVYEDKKVSLDKWGIEVRPYLTLNEVGNIIAQILTCENGIERDKILISNIIVACTDLYYEGMDFDYEYEQILYSGFWKDLLDACPILKTNIDTIYREVEEALSSRNAVVGLINQATEKIKEFDINKIDVERIGKFIERYIPKEE